MRFDQTGKGILQEALAPAGATHLQHEIASEVQWADLLFEPDRARAPARRSLGLLGRMTMRDCLFEPFRCTPRLETVRSCVRKLLPLHRARALRAARGGAPRPPFPRLWVLSPGRPYRVIRRFHLCPMRGWPRGFLRSAPALGLRLVVLRDLPRTRETLLLRLLGRHRTMLQAVEDLLALPEGAWERQVALPHLIAWRVCAVDNAPAQTAEEKRLMATTHEIYEQWKRRIETRAQRKGLKEGVERGLERGLQEGLLAAYQARFGAVPDDLATAIAGTHDLEILRGWFALVWTASAAKIASTIVRATRRRVRNAG